MSEEKVPDNLDQADLAAGLVAPPGPSRAPAGGEPPPPRDVQALGDRELIAAIDVRPDFLDLLDEQARRDTDRYLRLRHRPEEWIEHIGGHPQGVLELLDKHTILAFYTRELARRRRAAPCGSGAKAPAAAGRADDHTHSFEEIAGLWEKSRVVSSVARMLSGPVVPLRGIAEGQERDYERVLGEALLEGPVAVGDVLYGWDQDSGKVRRARLRRGSEVRVACPGRGGRP